MPVVFERKWIYGGPRDIWIRNEKLAGELIAKYKLQPYAAAARNKAMYDPDIRGGIRMAHLHAKGNIYLVEEKAWNEFSGRVIRDFRAKLENAQSVNFEQLMDISDAMEGVR